MAATILDDEDLAQERELARLMGLDPEKVVRRALARDRATMSLKAPKKAMKPPAADFVPVRPSAKDERNAVMKAALLGGATKAAIARAFRLSYRQAINILNH